jgi:hypothetical protein
LANNKLTRADRRRDTSGNRDGNHSSYGKKHGTWKICNE